MSTTYINVGVAIDVAKHKCDESQLDLHSLMYDAYTLPWMIEQILALSCYVDMFVL